LTRNHLNIEKNSVYKTESAKEIKFCLLEIG